MDLLKQRPGTGADAEAHAWAVQHATAIHQMTTLYAFDWDDPEAIPDAMLYRDRTMAENVAWWQRRTGDKIALAAHNSHIALKTYVPKTHPKAQGHFLREQLGRGYQSIGLTFDQGSFNALGQDGGIHHFTVGPAAPGTIEHTLDRVRYRDFVVDLRDSPAPAHAWLTAPHTVKNIGATYPWSGDNPQIRLAETHDVIIHLQRVEAAHMRPGIADHVAPLTVTLVMWPHARGNPASSRGSSESRSYERGHHAPSMGWGMPPWGARRRRRRGMGGRRGLQRGGHESSCQLPCGGGGE